MKTFIIAGLAAATSAVELSAFVNQEWRENTDYFDVDDLEEVWGSNSDLFEGLVDLTTGR